MSKDKKKSKKHDAKADEVKAKKKGKGKKGDRFPQEAAPRNDESALVDVVRAQTVETKDGVVTGTSPAALTDSLSKKDRKRIEALEVGKMHNLVGAEHLHRMFFLNRLESGDQVLDGMKPKKSVALAKAEVAFYRVRGEKLLAQQTKAAAAERAKIERQPDGTPKREPKAKVEKVTEPEVDEELASIKARVEARRKERYDAMIAEGATEEAARQMSRFQAIRDEDPQGLTLGKTGRRIMTATLENYTEDDRALDLAAGEPEDQATDPAPLEEAVAALEHEVSVVETEAGREFVAGAPSESDQEAADRRQHNDEADLDPKDPQVDEHGVRWSKHANPRPYIVMPDGKERLMSRVTSWIDVLDDKSALKDWSDRCLLIGAARASANLDPDTDKVEVVSFVNELTHEYEHDLKHADKALRKGKSSIEEHATAVADIEKAYKAALRHLAEELKERGDAHVKAQKGTDLHQVFQDFDEAMLAAKGKLTIDEWLESAVDSETNAEDGSVVTPWRDHLSPADIADLRAYRAAMDEAGIVVVDCEQRVVLDDDGVTGTYDRLVKYKPRNGQRVVKVIGDVKTGRIDFGVGKFATQIGAYAEGKLYTPGSGERTAHGASRTVGILIHSPAGQGVTTIYEVDLSVGKKGLALIRSVHDWRRATTEAKALRSKTESERFLVEVSRGTAE